MFQVRNYYSFLLLLLAPTAAHAYQRAYGFCEKGGEVVVTGGVNSTTRVQRSYPQCTVNVYLTGTLTLATIYSDNVSTPRANPFTATTTGYWFFYAANGRYDVTISGAGLSAPFTFGDVLLADPTSGPGGVTSVTAGPGVSVSPNTGAVVVSNLLGVNAQFYNFTPQVPGVNLTGGVAVGVTLTPCPLGVNGSDSTHYLYISGGTGSAEAVLIAGGTCTSGASTGTVIFTPANSHSGAWSISSAFGGVQEAISALAGTEGIVYVMNSITAHGTLTINSAITLQCSGNAVITWAGPATTAIAISVDGVTIRDCSITGGSATNVITNSGTPGRILIHNNYISGGYDAVNFTGGSNVDITNNRITGFNHTGIGTQFNVNATYFRAIGNYVNSAGCTVQYCGAISFWGSHNLAVGNQVIIGGNQDGGVFIGNTPTSGIIDGTIADNSITAVGGTPFECSNIGNIRGFQYNNNSCLVANSIAGAFIGFEVGGSSSGTMSGNTYDGGDISVHQFGMLVQSTSFLVITGNTFRGLGNDTDSHGIALLHTNGDALTTLNMVGNLISNNVVHSPLSRGSHIVVDTACDPGNPSYAACMAGNVRDNTVSDNTVIGSNISGEVCIRVSNNASIIAAQYYGTRISGNTLDTCATGIGTYDTPNNIVDGNHAMNTPAPTIYDDISSGLTVNARVNDLINGIPFASIGGQYTLGHLNGSMIYCTDCTIANPCAGSGTGAMAKRLNAVWVCN